MQVRLNRNKKSKKIESLVKRWSQIKKETSVMMVEGFLLEGKSRVDYEHYCRIFDDFITGPALEGREIAELTEEYQNFHDILKEMQLKTSDSNKLEDVVYGVAIEAEMQGFIYGMRLFDVLMNKKAYFC